MNTVKAEQQRLLDYAKIYLESSEETTVGGADLLSMQQGSQQHQDNMEMQGEQQKLQHKVAMVQAKNPPPTVGGSTPASKANKTITSRRTTLGKSTVTKQGMKTLKKGSK